MDVLAFLLFVAVHMGDVGSAYFVGMYHIVGYTAGLSYAYWESSNSMKYVPQFCLFPNIYVLAYHDVI